MGDPGRGRGQEVPDVMHEVSSTGGLLDDPPDYERDRSPAEDGFETHVASHGRLRYLRTYANLRRFPGQMLAGRAAASARVCPRDELSMPDRRKHCVTGYAPRAGDGHRIGGRTV